VNETKKTDRNMKRLNCIQLVVALVSLTVATGKIGAAPVGTAFTYQGRLTDGTNVANGLYDLQCVLFDAASPGNPVGPTNLFATVAVSNGHFTLALDFGGVAFDGNARWLEIGVRTNGLPGDFTPLRPRQAEVEVLENNSDEQQERYNLRVIRVLRRGLLKIPESSSFEVSAARNFYVGWTLSED